MRGNVDRHGATLVSAEGRDVTRVLVADDQRAVREALSDLIDLERDTPTRRPRGAHRSRCRREDPTTGMTRAARIRVLVADDHAAIRSALAAVIEGDADLQLSGVAADAGEAVELAAREQPDVALVDVRMPGGGAVAAVRGIAASSPRTRVLLLSATAIVPDALEAEVAGCIPKGTPIRELVDSLKRVAADQPLSIRPSP